MHYRFCSLLACAMAAPFAFANEAPKAATAFVHVNVVPMDRQRVLRDQTVLVEDGTIVALGRDLPVPREATVIDGGMTPGAYRNAASATGANPVQSL